MHFGGFKITEDKVEIEKRGMITPYLQLSPVLKFNHKPI